MDLTKMDPKEAYLLANILVLAGLFVGFAANILYHKIIKDKIYHWYWTRYWKKKTDKPEQKPKNRKDQPYSIDYKNMIGKGRDAV